MSFFHYCKLYYYRLCVEPIPKTRVWWLACWTHLPKYFLGLNPKVHSLQFTVGIPELKHP